MTLSVALESFFHKNRFNTEKTCWIAYSGGLDSHVLLTLCYQYRLQNLIHLKAIHINHGLNKEAFNWSCHCRKNCEDLQIDYVEFNIHIDSKSGDSLEEEARKKRYACFSECIKEGDFLLTAHHQDDQAETFFLQLFRGAGLKGLSAMPIFTSFFRGFHGRPLLSFSRNDLKEFALLHQLKWIEDESNINFKFNRNYIRHELMPVICKRWPNVATVISRSAEHCAEAQHLLESISELELEQIKGRFDHTISVDKLANFNPSKQRLLLRTWIAQRQFPLPNTRKLLNLQNVMLHARKDKSPCVAWGHVEMRRYRDDLYLMTVIPELSTDAASCIWNIQKPCHYQGLGTLYAVLEHGSGIKVHINQLHVRFRVKGESVHFAGRVSSLKKLFQEYGVPPWERYRIPLLFHENKLIEIPGYVIDHRFIAKNQESGNRIVWRWDS